MSELLQPGLRRARVTGSSQVAVGDFRTDDTEQALALAGALLQYRRPRQCSRLDRSYPAAIWMASSNMGAPKPYTSATDQITCNLADILFDAACSTPVHTRVVQLEVC